MIQGCFIFLLSFCTVVIWQCNTKFTQPNPPITELSTITIATTTDPKKKLGNFQSRGIIILDTVSSGDVCPEMFVQRCLSRDVCLEMFVWRYFSEDVCLRMFVLIVCPNYNKTSHCPILSVIILVTDKSDSCFADIWFC